MNALEDSEFSRAWAAVARSIPKPRAVICISAHWETAGTKVTAMEQPRTIHDFYGFPAALSDMQYPAPGSPELAVATQTALKRTQVELDHAWGLDHGAWAVLCRMFPKADVPVIQLSLDRRQGPAFHYDLGCELGELRRKGVLILGSGNVVHNLRHIAWEDKAFDWALEFDAHVRDSIVAHDHNALIHYSKLGNCAQLSVPTPEHYLPLLYVLGAQTGTDNATFFANRVTLGSMSMRSVRIG